MCTSIGTSSTEWWFEAEYQMDAGVVLSCLVLSCLVLYYIVLYYIDCTVLYCTVFYRVKSEKGQICTMRFTNVHLNAT